MALFAKTQVGFVATEELFLDRSQRLVLKSGDPRSAFLLARKGGVVPPKLVAALGLTESTKADEISVPVEPSTTSPEAIETRATRPEKPHRTR